MTASAAPVRLAPRFSWAWLGVVPFFIALTAGYSKAARRAAGPERELLHEVGCDLGRGLASVVTLLDLRCFVIGGGFGAALDTLVEGAHAGLAERCFGERVDTVRILPAELGADAGWIGAARLKHPSRRI